MHLLRSALAGALAGGALIAISATALAVDPTPGPTPTPTPSAAAAGPLTMSLICDTGPNGSGTFTVSANGKSSTLSVKCGKSASVTKTAWKAGSKAVIHQTAAATGALRGRDVNVTLKATANAVTIRNFRPTSTSTATTLAQTGGRLPALPIGLGLVGLLLVATGARVFARTAAQS